MRIKFTICICVSLILGFTILGVLIYFSPKPNTQDLNRYEIKVGEGNLLYLLDKQTGECWTKYENRDYWGKYLSIK